MKYFKYGVLEYAEKSMIYGEGGIKTEYVKVLHQTNSKMIMYLIILLLKINKIKYEVIRKDR